jgi:hypothetical protein
MDTSWVPVVAGDEWRDDEVRGGTVAEYLEVLVQVVPAYLQVAVPPRDRRVGYGPRCNSTAFSVHHPFWLWGGGGAHLALTFQTGKQV